VAWTGRIAALSSLQEGTKRLCALVIEQMLFDMQVSVDSREGLAGLRELAGSVRRLEAKLDQLVVAVTNTVSHGKDRLQCIQSVHHVAGQRVSRSPSQSALGSDRGQVSESGCVHPSVALDQELLQVAAPSHLFVVAGSYTGFRGREDGQLATRSAPRGGLGCRTLTLVNTRQMLRLIT
jgi:hypothetical protein